MFIHPDIAALRSDPARQRRVKAVMAAAQADWSYQSSSRTVLAALDRFGAGEPLASCGALSDLVHSPDKALAFVQPWVEGLLEALRKEPLGEVPHRYRHSTGLSSVQIAQSGSAALNLVAYERVEPNGKAPVQSALFQDRESHEIVLSGRATGLHHRLHSDKISRERVETWQKAWSACQRISLNDRNETRQIMSVDGVFVLLQLTRTPARPLPSQEIRISDGALLSTTSGDKGASERLMAISVLGAMGHASSLAAMTCVAKDRDEDDDVRWEAVRQLLAIDGAQGMALLKHLGSSPDDPLCLPARTLCQHLSSSMPAGAGHFMETA